MIYEVRTYTLKPGSVATFEANFAQALPHRQKYSPLAAFWHTEIGPLNQVIHVWPYESLDERTRIRAAAAQDPPLAAPKRPRNVRQDGIRNFPPRPLYAPPRRRPGPGQHLRNALLHLQNRRHGRSPKALGSRRPPPRGTLPPGRRLAHRTGRAEQVGPHLALPRPGGTQPHPRSRRPIPHWPPPTREFLVSQENKIMVPAAFSPTH